MHQQGLSIDERQRSIALSRTAITNFNAGGWQNLGAHTGQMNVIAGHDDRCKA